MKLYAPASTGSIHSWLNGAARLDATRSCAIRPAVRKAISGEGRATTSADVRGGTLYATHFPCTSCAKTIVARGIHYVAASKPDADYLSRWGAAAAAVEAMFKEAGWR